jgi:ABC-type antimicrobial peptide transport system permease subunit
MRQRLMESVNDRSFATLIVVFFGIAAIGVSAAGIVGAVGFVVARRTREIAIRLAIGASAGTVRRLVAREAGVAAAIGAAAGLTAARWAWATAGSLLYGIEPTDTLSFVLAASATVAVVVVAAWIPARRASRLSPNIALRAE